MEADAGPPEIGGERARVRTSGPGSAAPVLSRGPAIRFALTFALLSAALLGFYYFPYSAESPIRPWLDGFLQRYASSAGFLIRWFEPHVQVIGQDIIGRYSLRIVKTCDAMDVTFLLTAAILAWPQTWKRRLLGAAGGVALLFALNVLRICTLYGIGIAFPSVFEVAHLDVWPAIILLVSIAYFWRITLGGRGLKSAEPS